MRSGSFYFITIQTTTTRLVDKIVEKARLQMAQIGKSIAVEAAQEGSEIILRLAAGVSSWHRCQRQLDAVERRPLPHKFR